MKKNKALTVFFCCFIGIFALLFLVLPKSETSVNEKRKLAKFPKLTVSAVLDGSFESGFEDYLCDHFPLREKLVALDAYFKLCTGRNGANGVYKGKDCYLINTPVEISDDALEDNLEAIAAFADKTKIPARIMIVPESGYIMSEKLPKLRKKYNDSAVFERAAEVLGGKAELVDLETPFLESKVKYQIYYKTDHHWTSRGAYLAYTEFAKARGFEPIADTEFDISYYDGFYGTSYAKSALWGEPGESVEVWRYPNDVSVEINDGAGTEEHDGMFFEEYLSETDMYSVYLGGNHALTRLTNHGNDGGRLLMLKDSYAHCLAPFLINHYSRIDMVDLRYYLGSVSELAAQENYDEIFMVYGLSSMCENRDISILE